MKYEIITTLNQKPESESLNCTATWPTWQHRPTVYWESDPKLTDPVWAQWRETAALRESGRSAQHTVRFSRQAQAQIRHLRSSTADYVIWLDADVSQHQQITDSELQSLMPAESELCTFLTAAPGPEPSWIAYNMRCARLKQFVNRLEDMYLTQEIFSLSDRHAAAVWDHCRQRGNYLSRSLQNTKTQSNSFSKSELAPWFRQHSGQKKQNRQ
jgi:hypothetical protein